MKKRIALVALSIVLVFSLTIGGTLMLFTAKSDTATNVVTVGDLQISLWETRDATKPAQKVGKDGFTGIDFGDIRPDTTLTKIPTVKHEFGADAYLRVSVDVVLLDSKGDALTLYDLWDLYYEDGVYGKTDPYTLEGEAEYWRIYGYIVELVDSSLGGTGNEWVYQNSGTVGNKNAIRTGYYYYVDGANLKPFIYDTETTPVFQTVTIPELRDWFNDESLTTDDAQALLNFLSQYKLNIEVTAQAVQIGPNAAPVGASDYAAAFSAIS